MMTIKNYNEQKDTWNWKNFPQTIQDNRNDIEDMMEFYDDDDDIKETIDLFLKSINDNLTKKDSVLVKTDKPKTVAPAKRKETIAETLDNTKYLKKVMPKHQQEILLGYERSEEKEYFVQLIKDLEKDFDLARKRQDLPLMDSFVKAHFFYGQTDWYILDYDPSENMFFGYVVLNGDTQNSEAGYISVDELQTIRGIELDFHFFQEPLGQILNDKYPGEFPEYKKESSTVSKIEKTTTAKKAAPKKTKVAKVINEKNLVDNNSIEYLLIRRFYAMIKKGENVVIPFNTVRLLYVAFNKAAVERKVRKTSENANLFNKCNEKLTILFEEFANPKKADVKIEFTDKKLFAEIEEFSTNKKVLPSVSLLKRFIAIQGTLPEVSKVKTLLKSIEKQIEVSNDRLRPELLMAKKECETYLYDPKEKVEVTFYGLSKPRNVCTNRIKCTGIDKSGKLHKGYKFQEHTGNIIKVRKQKLGSPKVCSNRVKCNGIDKSGKLKKGYKFQENTGNIVAVKKKTLNAPVNNYPVETVIIRNATAPAIEMIQPIVFNEKNTMLSNPLPLQTKAPEKTVTKSNEKLSSGAKRLLGTNFDTLAINEEWSELMQNPAANLKIAIWGKPKNGKTSASLQMAEYFTNFGKVLYNFADQGFNLSTQELWKSSGLANNSNAEPSDISTTQELEAEIATGQYKFVFIDMISDYIRKEKLKPEEFKERFVKRFPDVSFILIFEVTKSGDFKGDQGWTHVVDAIMTVENFFMENRGRYGMGERIIWEEGFQRFNPKRYEEYMREKREIEAGNAPVETVIN
ncbi:hypothetical protein [Flavobacterium sp. N2820]|uniref:hypothetical protein n=1 Tax=Flavobacterium sp. N2820 TaxID=2986834 RepID=UPI0022243C1D|nr:hypothetical protein [Flavobacterium sp. N2820]